MYEYSHGGNAAFESGHEDMMDLSANINPLGMPDNVSDAIIREISNCGRYPDSFSRGLCGKIAEFERVSSDRIFCGSGASDIIFRLPRALDARKIIITAPAFADYERSGKSFGAEIIRHTLSASDGFALNHGFIETIKREKPGLVFVCNPNNPTGRLTEAGFMEKLLDCCRKTGARLIVDECFLDFAEQADIYTSKIYLERYSNLIILKAFTKLFALPGIRLGYAICADKTIVDALYFHGADWPVSNLAQAAGVAALDGAEDFIRRTVSYVSAEREAEEKELSRLGFKVFESGANYIFLQNPYPFDLRDELDKKGIRIRSCGNYNGLDGSYYRIAVSKKENNARLLSAVTEIIKNSTIAQ